MWEAKSKWRERTLICWSKYNKKCLQNKMGLGLPNGGCLIECLAQKSLIEMDVDEQLTDVDEFLIALWQEMKVPYMGTFQFLLWVGDYFLFRFYDENSLFASRLLGCWSK